MPWNETVRFLMAGLAILMISNVPYLLCRRSAFPRSSRSAERS